MYLAGMGALGTVAFFAAHAVYGLVVGGVYADLPLAARARTTDLDILHR